MYHEICMNCKVLERHIRYEDKVFRLGKEAALCLFHCVIPEYPRKTSKTPVIIQPVP